MQNLVEPLKRSNLFKALNTDEISGILNEIHYTVVEYKKNSVIAVEDDECASLGLILEGGVEMQKTYPSGKVVILNHMAAGNVFGEALIFSKVHRYPVTIMARESSKVMFITKENIIRLCSRHPLILQAFMEELSNKILMMNKKIKDLSFETIRQKLCDFLLQEYRRQKSLTIQVPLSRRKMADSMGVQRPSLSRELIKMKAEGLIDFRKDVIEIKDIDALEDCLM